MGLDAEPTYNLLLAQLNNTIRKDSNQRFGITLSTLSVKYINTLKQVSPDKKDVVGIIRTVAKKTNADFGSRGTALNLLYDYALDDKELFAVYLSLLIDSLSDSYLREDCIIMIASFGSKSEPALPELRKLKLSDDKLTRETVAKAIEAIESDKADEYKLKFDKMRENVQKDNGAASNKDKKIEKANAKEGNVTKENDQRKKWLNTTYNSTFIFVKDKEWTEIDNKTKQSKMSWKELSRTAEYIELYSDKKKEQIRLYPKKLDFLKNGKWEWLSNGKYQND